MASTPPRVTGSPESEAHRRWVEEQISELRGESAVVQKRVTAIDKQATIGGSVAAGAATQAREVEDATIGVDSNNRIARPILDPFWGLVTSQERFVFERRDANDQVIERSNSRNVTWTPGGQLVFQPNADTEGAEIHVTPILPIPPSGKLYLEARYFSGNPTAFDPQIWVEWRDPDGAIIDASAPGWATVGANPLQAESDQVVSVPKTPTGAFVPSFYSVILVRPAGAGIGLTSEPKVFEAVGKDGLSVSPGGISVEDGDGDKTIEINPSLPTLAAPSTPTLTSSVGSVSVRWDGLLTSGPAPAHLDYVFAEEATSSAGPWVRTGQPLKRAGDVVTRPPVGSTRWYRFTAMDTSGRPSTQSLVASVTVQGVDIPDLSGDIGDIIETVDGLNKIFYQTIDVIPEAHANGDLWFILDEETLAVVEVRIWNGSIWNPYRFVADSVFVPGTVGTISLEDGAVTAPKVKARELEGEHLKVGSVSVDELTPNIGSTLDISINPSVGAVQDGLEQQQRRFRFGENGLEIGDPATDEALRIDSGRIEMRQGGNVPTWWEAQNFYVERMIVKAANIGSHRFEGYANGRTVIRPLRGV